MDNSRKGSNNGGGGNAPHFTRKIPKFLAQMGVKVTDNGRTNAQELADSATVVRDREEREDNDDEAPVVVCEDTGLEVMENKKEEKAVSIGAPGELDDEILVASSKGGGTKKDKRRRIVSDDGGDDDDDNVVGPLPGPVAARAKSVAPITAKKAKPVLSFADYDD